jgi:hypothetical protein
MIGGGYGPRALADGTVVFTQPLSRRAMSVVGEFNGWNPRATPFIESADQRRLEATVRLPSGTHLYRIAADGGESLDDFNNLRDEALAASIVVVPGVRDDLGQSASGGARMSTSGERIQ